MSVVRARLDSLFSAEALPADLFDWQPTDPEHFSVSVQVFLNAQEGEGVDSFDVLVCTPSWLVKNWSHPQVGRLGLSPEVKSGHGLLLMQRWDYGALEAAIKQLCEGTTGRAWGDVANRIGRHLPWEFDYRYDKYQDEGRAIE